MRLRDGLAGGCQAVTISHGGTGGLKVTIRDRGAMMAVRPERLVRYLRDRGWREAERVGNRGAVYVLKVRGTEYEVLVPLVDGLADHALRVGDILAVLEEVEARSQLDIYRDIMEG